MSRKINPFGLRMPAELRHHLEKSALANRRSMNAELVLRLQESLEAHPLLVPEIREPAETYALTAKEAALLSAWESLNRRGRRALLDLLTVLDARL
jgi:type II secretory pathway predicted ATPase ExeA